MSSSLVLRHIRAQEQQNGQLTEVRMLAARLRIRRLRERLGLTQMELAQRLAVSFAAVNRWENKKTKPTMLAGSRSSGWIPRPRQPTLRLAKAYYSVPPEHLGRPVWARWDTGRSYRLKDRTGKQTRHDKQLEPVEACEEKPQRGIQKRSSLAGFRAPLPGWFSGASRHRAIPESVLRIDRTESTFT